MEKDLIQELMYDLEREHDLDKQMELVIVCADMLCVEDNHDAWDFFYQELNESLAKYPTDIIKAIRSIEDRLSGKKIKVLG